MSMSTLTLVQEVEELEQLESEGHEISADEWTHLYHKLRDQEIEETLKAIHDKQQSESAQPQGLGEDWLLTADLQDPKYTNYDIGKLQELQEALRNGIALEHCSDCQEIYPSIGYWGKCVQEGNFRHGHDRVIARNAQSNTVTAYYINQRTGKVWMPGQNAHRSPIDKFGKPIPGYERHEVKNFRERDKFYKLMDGMAKKEYFGRLEREQKLTEPVIAENRKQLRQNILSTEAKSPEASYGREWYEKMTKKTDDAAAAKLNYSPNTYLDGWEFDANNQGAEGASYGKVLETLSEKQPTLAEHHKQAVKRGVARSKAEIRATQGPKVKAQGKGKG